MILEGHKIKIHVLVADISICRLIFGILGLFVPQHHHEPHGGTQVRRGDQLITTNESRHRGLTQRSPHASAQHVNYTRPRFIQRLRNIPLLNSRTVYVGRNRGQGADLRQTRLIRVHPRACFYDTKYFIQS